MKTVLNIEYKGEEIPVEFTYDIQPKEKETRTDPHYPEEMIDIIWEDVPESLDAFICNDSENIHSRLWVDANRQKQEAIYESRTKNL